MRRMKCKMFSIILVFLLMITTSCGATKKDISTTTLSQANAGTDTNGTKDKGTTDSEKSEDSGEGSIYPLSVDDDQNQDSTYEIIAALRGSLFSSKEVEIRYDMSMAQANDIGLILINEVSRYLGLPVSIKNINYLENEMTIDFEKSSIPIQSSVDETDTLIKYSSYDEMAFSVLDSILMTMRSYFGKDLSIIYQIDGEDLKLNKLRMEVDFSTNEEYMGYLYYENLYDKRNEEQETDVLRLNTPYNDVIEILFDQEVEFTQKVDLSVLGDQTDWELYTNVDEYLKKAWTQIQLVGKDYSLHFDGQETLLGRVIHTSSKAVSRRGLSIGDSLTRLFELYGNDYKVFERTNSNLYEFSLLDHYFVVDVDNQRKKVINFGVSSYSEQDIIDGYKILDLIYQKELEVEKEQDNTNTY